MASRIVPLVVGLLWCMWSTAAAPVPVLLVLGDSLSAGYGLKQGEAWPDLLRRKLESLGHPCDVVNASISGETSRGGLTRLPALLDEHRPSVVVIELGANDGLRGLPLDEFAGNMQMLVQAVITAGAAPIVVPMQVPPNYGRAYANGFAEVYAGLPAQFPPVSLTPFFLEDVALDPDLMQADGLHPTAAAQPTMLESVWPAIKSKLRAAGESQQ
jgi:acyl-CoA thioesterase-1